MAAAFASYAAGPDEGLDDCATQAPPESFSEEQDEDDFLSDEALMQAAEAAEAANDTPVAVVEHEEDEFGGDNPFWQTAASVAALSEAAVQIQQKPGALVPAAAQAAAQPPAKPVEVLAAGRPSVKPGDTDPPSAPVSPVSPSAEQAAAAAQPSAVEVAAGAAELDATAGQLAFSPAAVGPQRSRSSRSPSPNFDSEESNDDADAAATQAWAGEEDIADPSPTVEEVEGNAEDAVTEEAVQAPGELEGGTGELSVEPAELHEVAQEQEGAQVAAADEAAADVSSDDEDAEMAALFKSEAEGISPIKRPSSLLDLGSQDAAAGAPAADQPATTASPESPAIDLAEDVAAAELAVAATEPAAAAAAPAAAAEAPSICDEREAPRVVELGDPVIICVGDKLVLAVKWNTNDVFSEVTLAPSRPNDLYSDWGRSAAMSERKNFPEKLVKKKDLNNRNGVHTIAAGAAKNAAKNAEEFTAEWGMQVPLYIDMYRGGFHSDGRNVGTQGRPEFCSTKPFKIHLTEDGTELLCVEILDLDALEKERSEIGRKEDEEVVAAKQEAERKKELERAVPTDCALCGAGPTDELGQLLAFRVKRDSCEDEPTWYAHRHCVLFCQTVEDADPKRRAHKKVAEHGFVAHKFVTKSKCITPGEMIKGCWKNKCSICSEKGAHLACHDHTCTRVFHLKCANSARDVAVCRDATAEWGEEINGWLMGHGPKDTFCKEHSAGRPLAEFEPVAVEKEEEMTAVSTAKGGSKKIVQSTRQYRDSSSSSSEHEDDELKVSECKPGAKKQQKRKRPAARSIPAEQPAAAVALVSTLVECGERWYKCVNQTGTKEGCDPKSNFKLNKREEKLRVRLGEMVVAKQVRELDGTTRVECLRVENGKKTEKNLGWVSLISRSGNPVLVEAEPETAAADTGAAAATASGGAAVEEQHPKQRRKEESLTAKARPSSQAASTGAAAAAAAAAPRPPAPRNLRPGAWEETKQADVGGVWKPLSVAVAESYEAAWQASKDTAEYSGLVDRANRYLTIDFADDKSAPGADICLYQGSIFRQVDYRSDKELVTYVRRRKKSKNEIAEGSASASATAVASAAASSAGVRPPTAAAAAAPKRARESPTGKQQPKKVRKMSLAKTSASSASGGGGGGASGGKFIADAPGGPNGSHAADVSSSAAASGPYGRQADVYVKKSKPKRKFANKVHVSSDEEEDSEDESSGGFVVPDAAPIETDGAADTVDLSTMDDVQGCDLPVSAGEDSDDDFRNVSGRSRRNETASRLRAVAQDAKANDSRGNVAAADAADMAAAAAAGHGGRALVLKCGDGHSCVCGKLPCAGGINQEHWQPNQLRCKTCECCVLHRKFDPEKGRKIWNNSGRQRKGGCCARRADLACPHNDPTQNQDSARLGNDDSFMDRDIDESRFDDFEEPMSEPEEEREEEGGSTDRRRGAAGGRGSMSSRREKKEAQHQQNVAQVRQQMQAGASGRASPDARIVRPVMSKKTGSTGMGFLRAGQGQPLPDSYRDLTSPPAVTAQQRSAAAAAASPQRGVQRGQHAAGRKEVAKEDRQARQQQLHVQAQKQRQAQHRQQQEAAAAAAAPATNSAEFEQIRREKDKMQRKMQQQQRQIEQMQRQRQQQQAAAAADTAAAADREEAEVEEDFRDSMCVICTDIVFEPAVTGCCPNKFCKACLEKWRKDGTNSNCPSCRSRAPRSGPVVVDTAYWDILQNFFPNAVKRRRAGLQPPQQPGLPMCKCRVPKAAMRMGPARSGAHPGCYWWQCADQPDGRGATAAGQCKFLQWEESGAAVPSAAARGRAAAAAPAAAPAPASRRRFF